MPRIRDQLLVTLLGIILLAGPYIPIVSTRVYLDADPAVAQEQR